MKHRYSYYGPVKEFGTIVSNKWSAETVAASDKKARSNLVYQYKKSHGLTSDCKITLPGKLELVY